MVEGSEFIGKWQLVRSENFEEYLKVLGRFSVFQKKIKFFPGVNFLLRKLALAAKPVNTFERSDDGHWTATSVSAVRTITTTFEMGVEFDYTTPDGRNVKVVKKRI
jgi:fatty acid-binding protein 3